MLRDEGRFEIYDEGGEFILEIFDLVPKDDGMYTVTAENSAGKVATGAQLTVHSRLTYYLNSFLTYLMTHWVKF